MNTGFLNRCRVLVTERRRALVVGQTLCLIVVAAIFFVAPFVALAGCGNNNNNVKVDNSLKAVAATSQINPIPGTNAINLSFIPKGVALDSMTLHPVTAADLVPGHWITLAKQDKDGQTEVFQASIFKVSQVNGNNKVVEAWVAELPGDPKANVLGLTIGQKFINVSESTLLGQNNNNNNN